MSMSKSGSSELYLELGLCLVDSIYIRSERSSIPLLSTEK
uniref:Uncharacterized protein n=1 Tax=Anguilla anguilla TaxID=7936 RepID=A0A0E9SZV6_ANGAN